MLGSPPNGPDAGSCFPLEPVPTSLTGVVKLAAFALATTTANAAITPPHSQTRVLKRIPTAFRKPDTPHQRTIPAPQTGAAARKLGPACAGGALGAGLPVDRQQCGARRRQSDRVPTGGRGERARPARARQQARVGRGSKALTRERDPSGGVGA